MNRIPVARGPDGRWGMGAGPARVVLAEHGWISAGSIGARPATDEVERAMEWITRFTKPGRKPVSSYGLKHAIEAHHGYISNGAAIEAALRLGVPVYGVDGPNAVFCLTFLCARCLKRLRRGFTLHCEGIMVCTHCAWHSSAPISELIR